jgi:hypothetical protein
VPPVVVGEIDPAPPAPAAPQLPAPAPGPPRGAPRFHVVRPGESLWSIAAALLGPRAQTVAIARQVARLWLVNERRIATGDPSLLPVGVKLRLR